MSSSRVEFHSGSPSSIAFLSNMYPCKITYDNHTFPSAEHMYQYAKAMICNSQESSRRILNEPNPFVAKQLGTEVFSRNCDKKKFDNVKVYVMWCVLCQKFKDKTLVQLLLSTGNRELVEATRDPFWGAGDQYPKRYFAGSNRLGRMLMALRKWHREGSQPSCTILLVGDSIIRKVSIRNVDVVCWPGGDATTVYRLARFVCTDWIHKVIVMAGTNNLPWSDTRFEEPLIERDNTLKRRPISKIVKPLKTGVEKLHECTHANIFVCEILPRFCDIARGKEHSRISSAVVTLNEKLRVIASEFERVSIVSLFSLFRPEHFKRTDGSIDLHLNKTGLRVLEAALTSVQNTWPDCSQRSRTFDTEPSCSMAKVPCVVKALGD